MKSRIRPNLIKIIVALLLLNIGIFTWAGSEMPVPKKHIQDVLDSGQFEKSGLNKLTETELNELSGALFGWKGEPFSEGDTVRVAENDSNGRVADFGKETLPVSQEDKPSENLGSRILGTFTGWKGKSVFHLENGQVWRQIDNSIFVITIENPEIVIEKGLFGTYYFQIKGYGSRCKVKRVK